MLDSKAREIHGQAAELREQGKSIESLKKGWEALEAYIKDKDYQGASEIGGEMSISLGHLYDRDEDETWLRWAKAVVIAGIDIAKKIGDSSALAVPLYNLAKTQVTLGEFAEAIPNYQESLRIFESNPLESHANRPAILADIKGHLAYSEYKNGDKGALERAESSLSELEKAEEISAYNKDVWLSGAHMRIAEMLREDGPNKAKSHLEAARILIDKNPELILRKTQWEKLAERFK